MGTDSDRNNEREYVELDRATVLANVTALRRVIRAALNQITLIVEESVFDRPLSARLSRNARALKRIGKRLDALNALLHDVTGAKPRKARARKPKRRAPK